MISRRSFVRNASILPLLAGADFTFTNNNVNSSCPDQAPLIKSISIIKATGSFNRFISMNAYDKASKGISGTQSLVKLTLSDGSEGIGGVGYVKPDSETLAKIKQLVGKDPFSFYHWKADVIRVAR